MSQEKKGVSVPVLQTQFDGNRKVVLENVNKRMKLLVGSSMYSESSDISKVSLDSNSGVLTREKVNEFLPVAEDPRMEGKPPAKYFVTITKEKGVNSVEVKSQQVKKFENLHVGNEAKTTNKYVNEQTNQNIGPERKKRKRKAESHPKPDISALQSIRSSENKDNKKALPKTNGIRFQHDDQWHASYVRTRHKNIRCFPFCSPIHRERSFCGQSLVVSAPYSGEKAKQLVLLGCFRKIREKLFFNLGGRYASEDINTDLHTNKNEMMTAIFTGYDANAKLSFFEFRPPRKWRYHCEQNKYTTQENHVFTLYVFEKLENDTLSCIGYADSPPFCIISAWNQSLDTVSRPFTGTPNETYRSSMYKNMHVNQGRLMVEYQGPGSHQHYHAFDSLNQRPHLNPSAGNARGQRPTYISSRPFETSEFRTKGPLPPMYEMMHEIYSALPHEDVVLRSYQQYRMRRQHDLHPHFAATYRGFPPAPDSIFPPHQDQHRRSFNGIGYLQGPGQTFTGAAQYNSYPEGHHENSQPRPGYPSLPPTNPINAPEPKQSKQFSNSQSHYYEESSKHHRFDLGLNHNLV